MKHILTKLKRTFKTSNDESHELEIQCKHNCYPNIKQYSLKLKLIDLIDL